MSAKQTSAILASLTVCFTFAGGNKGLGNNFAKLALRDISESSDADPEVDENSEEFDDKPYKSAKRLRGWAHSLIWNNGSNLYTCTNTEDKIFLLSEREVSTSKYGFADYSESGTGNSRIRFPTDYAKAKYAYKSYKAEEGGNWWLRSPHYSASNQALCVEYDGDLVNMRVGGVPKTPAAGYVSDEEYGIVPALSILE